jgi:bifunctional DNA primase/polymerase-like protein
MTKIISAMNLAAALSLANASLRVFPARAIHNAKTGRWNKPPCIKEWQTSASADPDDVARWWQQFPDAIPAISCTEIVVIDADRHPGAAEGVLALVSLVALHQDWPQHPIVLTPSGGEHHYFRQPTRPLGNGSGLLPSGIDVRGVGDFVIGPGATLPDGTGWQSADALHLVDALSMPNGVPQFPEWLEKIIRADRITPTDANSTSGSPVTNREKRYAETALEGAAQEVETAPRGRRNTVLNGVAFRLGRMVGSGWIARNIVAARLLSAASDLKREDGEIAVKATIQSGLKAGQRQPHPDLADRGW